jgi:HAD superfamily hydrolase (TIGR01549 family)
MIPPGIKAIAFDLYGTLIYVAEPHKPYNKLFETLKLTEEVSRNVRTHLLTKDFDSVRELVKHIVPSFTGDLSKIEESIKTEVGSATLYPETIHVLEKLSQSYDLYLVSNLSTPFKQPVFDLGIDKYFRKMFFSCECGSLKPKAGIYNMLVKESGYRANELLMAGNSLESDYQGARSCGLDSVLVDRSRKHSHSIGSLVELC